MRLDVETTWQDGRQVRCEMFGAVYTYPLEDVARIEKQGIAAHTRSTADEAAPRNGNNAVNTSIDALVRFYQAGQWKKAEQAARELYHLHPTDRRIRDTLVRFYMDYAAWLRKNRRVAEAIHVLKKAASCDPRHAPAIKQLTAMLVASAVEELGKRNQ